MSSDSTFDELWNQALERYFTLTGRSLEDKAVLKRLHNPEDLYSQIEADQQKFSNFRNKHTKLFKALSRTVKPFAAIAGIVSNAVSSTPYAPATVVFGSVLFLVQATCGVSEAYDWIEQLFDKLYGFVQRLEEYVQVGMNAHLRQKIIVTLACLLEILARSEKLIKDGRFKKYAAVLFLGKDEEVQASFSKLAKLFDDEQRLVQAITYTTNQRIDKTTEEIDETTKKSLKTVEHMDAKLNNVNSYIQGATSSKLIEEQKAVLDAHLLTTANAKNVAIYAQYAETALPKSGEWLLLEEKFKNWLDRETPLLWVAGGPGTGKSYLSAITISKLKSIYPQDSAHPNHISVAYFYVKKNDQESQDLGNILKSIACQIVQVDAVFRSHAINVLSKPETIITPRKAWKNLFLNFYSDLRDFKSAAMIVLDGLDEAPKETLKELFIFLEDLVDVSGCYSRLSFAIFGRPELAEYLTPKARRYLSKVYIGEKNNNDIAIYIKENLKRVLVVRQAKQQKARSTAAALGREIRDKIMTRADGMFFKVVLIMDQIYDKERKAAVFEAIEAAPPGLEEMIAHVFEKLTLNEDVNKDDLSELLLWVCFAKRPLYIAELYAILKLRTGEAYDALEDRLHGRFASLFKLGVNIDYSAALIAKGDAAPEAFLADGDDFDIDDLSSYDDEFEEGVQEDLNAKNSDKATKIKYEKDDQLSHETLERFQYTDVRFTHISIRDFLVKPRDINSDRYISLLGISVDQRTADMHVASICIQRIIDYTGINYDCDFMPYAESQFMNHLTSIDATSITSTEKQAIIEQICKLFFNVQGIGNLIRVTRKCFKLTIHAFFENPKFAATVRNEWLKQAVRDRFTTEEWEWIERSRNSSKEFFRPFALQASKLWLTKNGHDDPNYCNDALQLYLVWIIYCYITFDDANDQEVKFIDSAEISIGRPPAYDVSSLQKLVEFSDIERTSHWYTSYGWILMLGGQHDEAIAHFQSAVGIDGNSWKALQGLAKCLVQQQRYDEAAVRVSEALRVVPHNLKWATSTLQRNLATVVLSQKDFKKAFDYAKDIYAAQPTNYQAIRLYIQSLYAIRDYQGILKVIQDLQQQNLFVFKEGGSITEQPFAFEFICLGSVQSEIGRALCLTGSSAIVKPWIYGPLQNPDFEVDSIIGVLQAYFSAEYIYWFFDAGDESQQLFERLKSLKPKGYPDPDSITFTLHGSFSDLACLFLSALYYEKAAAASKAGQNNDEWVKKLRSLAVVGGAEPQADPVYQMNTAALALGVYLRRYGGATRSTWADCMRNYLNQAIDMLGDDDPFNDVEAYSLLVKVLLAAGDIRNACAAAAPIFMPDEAASDPDKLKALNAIRFPSRLFACDGLCTTIVNTYKDVYKELHFCEECIDTCFCEECFPIVKKGELPHRKCSPDHQFVQLFPVPEDAKGVAARFVDQKTMEVQKEWLNDLRKDWS